MDYNKSELSGMKWLKSLVIDHRVIAIELVKTLLHVIHEKQIEIDPDIRLSISDSQLSTPHSTLDLFVK